METYTAKDAEKPIGLYLGAGVNLPTRKVEKKYFDTYSWGELLRAVYVRNLDKYDKSFERMKAESSGDWAKLASALVGRMSVEELVAATMRTLRVNGLGYEPISFICGG